MRLRSLAKQFKKAKLKTKLYLILILPILALSFYAFSHFEDQVDRQDEFRTSEYWLDVYDRLDFLIFSLQIERGLSSVYAVNPEQSGNFSSRLKEARLTTNQALKRFLDKVSEPIGLSFRQFLVFQRFEQDMQRIRKIRDDLDHAHLDANDAFYSYLFIVQRIIRLSAKVHEQFDSDLNFVLSVHGDLHLLEMTESLGKQRTLITMDLFDLGYLSTATRNEIIQSHQDFVQAFNALNELEDRTYFDSVLGALNSPVAKYENSLRVLLVNSPLNDLSHGVSAEQFWDLASAKIDQLSLVQHANKFNSIQRLKSLQKDNARALLASIAFAAFVFMLSILSVVWVRRSVVDSVEDVQSQLSQLHKKTHSDARISVEGAYEISEISRSINRLLSELEDNQKELVLKSRYAVMGEMIGMIGHQWRQPLTVVTGLVDVMEMQIEASALSVEEKAKFKLWFEDIFIMLKEMDETINDFKGLNDPNKPQGLFNVGHLIEFSKQMTQSLAVKNDVTLTVQGKAFDLFGVERELLQVMLNLIKNAIEQHSLNSNDEKYVRIHLRSRIQEDKQIIVEDNAGGVPEALLEHLFDAYFSTKSLNGTGLGLYMSKMIVEKTFNGEMRVENTEVGARFILTFPNEFPTFDHPNSSEA